MKRALLTQIKNDWKDNVWLVLELAIVTAAIWVITTFLYVLTQGIFQEKGFSYEDVYTLDARIVSENSPEYVETGDSTNSWIYTDRNALLKRLREHPDVESVAISNNAIPYNYNYYGNRLELFDEKDTIPFYGNLRRASPDIVRVLKLKSLSGLDEDALVASLAKGEVLGSDNPSYNELGRDHMSLRGKRIIIGGDSSKVYVVGDLIANVRRNEYEPSQSGTIIVPLDESNRWTSEVAVRVKPGHGDSFKASFLSDRNLQRQRNVYFTNIRSLADVRDACQRQYSTTVRMFSAVICFLLITIFLGLLGSFWFRIQQRVSEIAIRKVCGATKGMIFRRILSEGFILLGLGALISAACVWPFFGDVGVMLSLDIWEALVIEILAIIIVALGIVISVLYPARRAMNINPAIAIKDE